jgi:hypothetical protein
MASRLVKLGLRFWVIGAALAVPIAGCGGTTVVENNGGGTGTGGAGSGTASLVGHWQGSATFGTTNLAEALTLSADGTASATDTYQVVGAGPCNGALVISDSWTSTSSTFSVAGGTCTGQVTCPMGITVACGSAETLKETCTYSLTADGATLVITCPQSPGPITYTRQG